MKTKGLTFQQALKALNDDKCVGIKPEKFESSNYYKKDSNGFLTHFNPLINNFSFQTLFSMFILLGKWNLIVEKISRTEQRILSYWVVIWQNGTTSLSNKKPCKTTYKKAQHVFEHHQKYIYTYPK